MPFGPDELIVHEDAELSYEAWEVLAARGRQPAQAVWNSILTAVARIRTNAQWGEVIRRSHIPRYFREKYGVSNLYCVDLAAFHRVFYTIANRNVIFLDLVDHPTYDKWFPGRRAR